MWNIKEIITGLLLCLLMTSIHAAIEVDVDRTQVEQAETFQMMLTSDELGAGVQPDLSPLDEDFIIFGISQGTQVRIINGEREVKQRWIVTLSPRRPGELTIPAIDFGGEKTKALSIQVRAKDNELAMDEQRQLLLEASVDRLDPYVQSEVVYTVKLYLSGRLLDASLTDPRVEHAIVLRLGDDQQYQAKKDDQLYQVIERRYAIFPEASGELLIRSPEFAGILRKQGGGGIDQFISRYGSPVQTRAKDITLQVKPIPEHFQGSWLPVNTLTVSESWPDNMNEVKVGDAITRTVVMNAEAVTSAQLPNWPTQTVTGAKVYPDKPALENILYKGQLHAQRKDNFVYVPTQAGELVLPEMALTWWNNQTGEIEEASLPAKTIQVVPGAAEVSPVVNTAVQAPSDVSLEVEPPAQPLPDVGVTQRAWLPWGVAVGFMLAWIVTLLLWLQQGRQRQTSDKLDQPVATISLRTANHALHHACQANDKFQAKQCLLAWAKAKWPKERFNHLQDVMNNIEDSAVKQQIQVLNIALYAPQAQVWEGQSLWEAWRVMREKKQKPPHKEEVLPPLYPRS